MRVRLRRQLLALSLASILVGAAACASVLGIDELGVRAAPPEGGAPDAPQSPCLVDAADASYCQTLCPPADFCDDFEGESQRLERWNGGGGPALGYSNKVIDNDANTIDIVPDELTGNTTLAARVVNSDRSATIALLAHEAKAPPNQLPRGARIELAGRLPVIDFVNTDASRDDKYLYVFAVGDGVRNEGVALVLIEGKKKGQFDVTLQQRGIAGSGETIVLGKLIDSLDNDYFNKQESWFKVELLIAPESVMSEIGDSCVLLDDDKNPVDASAIPGVPSNGLRVLVRFLVGSRCFPLRGDFARPDWLPRLILLAGVVMGDVGSAELRGDNVTVRFIY